jgi:preprotein translocase subunit SecG
MNAKHGAYVCLALTAVIAVATVIMFHVSNMELSSLFSKEQNIGDMTFAQFAVPLVLVALTFFFLGLAIVFGIYHVARTHS